MTRKDYILLADALKDAKNCAVTSKGSEQWTYCVVAIAQALKSDNPRFIEDRFYDRCGLEQQ